MPLFSSSFSFSKFSTALHIFCLGDAHSQQTDFRESAWQILVVERVCRSEKRSLGLHAIWKRCPHHHLLEIQRAVQLLIKWEKGSFFIINVDGQLVSD